MKQILDDEIISDRDNLAIENIVSHINMTENINIKDYLDTDNDGIPDDWTINGYTVENCLIVPWDETRHPQLGLIKYVSDPFNSRTTGDPYTDLEKVLGKVDPGILEEARHPLVAAYPKIGVEMKKIILSNNSNVRSEKGMSQSKQKSNTVTASTSNSHQDSTTVGASVSTEVHASLLDIGVSVSVSANYSHEWSNTVTVDHSTAETTGQESGQTWTQALEMQESEVALLNGNVNYINVATAPIYNVKPTLNFVLGLGENGQTIATIVAKSNTLANVLLPGKIYPEKGQNPISWNTIDDFNSQPIKLNIDQVNALENHMPLQIQTIQTSGLYKLYYSDNLPAMSESQKWEHIMVDIYSRTACITIMLENGTTQERRVAARKSRNYQHQTIPELTLGQAIELAFKDTTVEKNQILYQNLILDLNYNVDIIFDKETENEIVLQTTNGIKNIFDLNLTQGMNFIFKEANEKAKKLKEDLQQCKEIIIQNKNIIHNYIKDAKIVMFSAKKLVNIKDLIQNFKEILITNGMNKNLVDDLKISVSPKNRFGNAGLQSVDFTLQVKKYKLETFTINPF